VQRYAARLLGITFPSPPISILRHAAAITPPPLGGRRLNCFWLIKAPECYSMCSKPGANSPPTVQMRFPGAELPVRITLNAHINTGVVLLQVHRRSHGFCVLSDCEGSLSFSLSASTLNRL